MGKRLELLKELLPRAQRVAFLEAQQQPEANKSSRDILMAASRPLGINVVSVALPHYLQPEAIVKAIVDSKADGFLWGILLMSSSGDLPRLIQLLQRARLPGVFND